MPQKTPAGEINQSGFGCDNPRSSEPEKLVVIGETQNKPVTDEALGNRVFRVDWGSSSSSQVFKYCSSRKYNQSEWWVNVRGTHSRDGLEKHSEVVG